MSYTLHDQQIVMGAMVRRNMAVIGPMTWSPLTDLVRKPKVGRALWSMWRAGLFCIHLRPSRKWLTVAPTSYGRMLAPAAGGQA